MRYFILAAILSLSGCVTAENHKLTRIKIEGVGEMVKETDQKIPWFTNVSKDQDTRVAIVKTLVGPDGKTTGTLAITYEEITRVGVDQGDQAAVANNIIETAGALIGAYIGYAFGSVPGAVGGAVVGDKLGETAAGMISHP